MSTDQSDSLTYVIPTHNRPQFLRRLLRYLAEVNCRNEIQIADSSSDLNAAINRETMRTYRSSLRLKAQHYELGVIKKCRAALDQVRTPYAIFNADDDFQVPAVINDCARFLDRHPGYGSCFGSTAIVHAAAPTVRLIGHRSIDSQCPLQRCFELSLQGNFSTFYGLHRTELLRRRFRLVAEHTAYKQCRIIPEVMLTQMCALQGQIRVIPATSLIKQSHARNETVLMPRVQNRDQAVAEYARYRAALGEFILDQAPQQTPARVGQLVDRNFRIMYPAPLYGRPLLLNRLRREFRKLVRHRTRGRHLGWGYLREQKGRHLPIGAFAAEAPEQALAVQLINAAERPELSDSRAA